MSKSKFIPGKARFIPATREFRASWGIDNPNGVEIYFESKELAEGTALIWADEWNA